jgi:L-amino acid N-acyltransferase
LILNQKTLKNRKYGLPVILRQPILIAEKDGLVIGWASLSKWSERCAYSDTAEVSVYIKEDHREKGIGRQLLKALLKEGKNRGLHTILARIAEGNQASINLFKSEDFQHVGVMKEVGKKFGKLLDVYIMQKKYD